MLTTSPSAAKYASNVPAACAQCMCSKCGTPLAVVQKFGESAQAMLACGHGHATSRQCLVCGAACDTATGSNVAQGPCWQEACTAAGVACQAGNPLSFQDLIPKCEQSAPDANGCSAVYGVTACVEDSCADVCPAFDSCGGPPAAAGGGCLGIPGVPSIPGVC